MKQYIVFVLLFFLIASLITGCFDVANPPTVDVVQSSLNQNMVYLDVVVQFMCTSQYQNIYILNAGGTMRADLTDVKIEDNEVMNAIEVLMLKQNYQQICKYGNTIYFMQWKSIHERDCGLAYSINGIDRPKVPDMTECISLDQEKWFFCFADYNLSRIQERE